MKYIITGTSSGLGYAIAERLVKHGHVIGISRCLGEAHKITKNFSHVKYDLSDVAPCSRYTWLLESLNTAVSGERFTLIFNAASFYAGNQRLGQAALKKLFEVNVLASMSLIRDLRTSGLRRILFINSVSGIIGQKNQHEYSASKHALMGYAQSLSKSARDSEFDVMSINPGGMKTELWNDYEDVDQEDFLEPSTVADLCLALLMLPERTFVENMIVLPPSDV